MRETSCSGKKVSVKKIFVKFSEEAASGELRNI